MTFVQFLSILRARWKTLLLVLAAVVVGTAIVNAAWPRSYTSTVAVLVDVKSPDPIAGIIYPGLSSPTYMTTQVDVVQSDRVSQHVVHALHLDESAAMRDDWRRDTRGKGNFESWVADTLRKRLDVKPSRDSSVLAINYKSADPKLAATLANAYAQAYLDVSLELRVDPARQYGAFFEKRASKLRDRVEQARATLTAFQREKGIVGNDERFDVENGRLADLSTQLVALQGVGAESAGRTQQARTAPGQIQDVLLNPLLDNLKTDLARGQARLHEFEARYGPNHPSMIELRANVDETRARLDAETKRVSGGAAVSDAINDARIARLQAAVQAQRAKVLQLKEARDRLAALSADVDTAQHAYDGVVARANQTELESGTTLTNLYILNPAAEPILPSSPRTTLNVLLAVFVGTLLGIGVALVTELFDRRVRAAADVAAAVGTPLLGTLKRRPGGRLFGRREPGRLKLSRNASPPRFAVEPAAGGVASLALDARGSLDYPHSLDAVDAGAVKDMALGQIFRETRRLDAGQIQSILDHQRERGVLFGEAAVALGLVSRHDVQWALSRQFHYPYATDGRRAFNPELVAATTPFSSVAETFRSIRSQLIRRADQDPQRRAIAVVSADGHDGKSFVASNLAIAFSQLGRRTLLLDADMRSPRLHTLFGIDNSRGLSGILAGHHSARALAPVDELPSLFVLPVGVAPPNPLELLESPAFGRLIDDLLAAFDHVIIDSPSAMAGADAGVIAARSGAFLSVARQGRTCMASMVELVDSLRDTTTVSLGFVLNEH